MQNMGNLNNLYEYTVVSIDYNFDVWMSKHITYVVTRPVNLKKYTSETGKSEIFISLIAYLNPF